MYLNPRKVVKTVERDMILRMVAREKVTVHGTGKDGWQIIFHCLSFYTAATKILSRQINNNYG